MQAVGTRTGLFVLAMAALLAAPAQSARDVIPTDSTPITVAYHGTFDLTNTIVPQATQHTFTYHVEWTFSWSGTWGELFSSGPISNQTSFAKSTITGSLHALWRASPTGPDLKCTLRIVPQMGDFPDFNARYYATPGRSRSAASRRRPRGSASTRAPATRCAVEAPRSTCTASPRAGARSGRGPRS